MSTMMPPAEMKWTAENLGPRQAKAVNDAMAAVSRAARTITELLDSGRYDGYSTLLLADTWPVE